MDENRDSSVPLKVLVCGDRNWNDANVMLNELSTLPENTIIIHGDARGADSMAGLIGEAIGFTVISVPAEWKLYGKRAGPIRNRKMYDIHQPNAVWAFHKNIESSKGTKDMISYAKQKNCKEIKLFK